MKRAFVGDIHGDLETFKKLHDLLKKMGVDEVWHLGDLVDKGPDPHGVIQFLIHNKVKGISGNHDQVTIRHWETIKRTGKTNTNNQDRLATLSKITQSDVDYLKSMPHIHVLEDIKTIAVHGGLHYKNEIWQNK